MKFLAVLALVLCCIAAALASGTGGSKRPSETDHSKSFLGGIGSHAPKKIVSEAPKKEGTGGSAFYNAVRSAQKNNFIKNGKH